MNETNKKKRAAGSGGVDLTKNQSQKLVPL